MRHPSTSPQPCPCGSTPARFFFLGWRCDVCAPPEAAIRLNATATRVRREAHERHLKREALIAGRRYPRPST